MSELYGHVEEGWGPVADAFRTNFEEGRHHGRPPFGYRRAHDADGRPTLERDTDKSKVVADVSRPPPASNR